MTAPGLHWRGPVSVALWGLALVAFSRALLYLPILPMRREIPEAIKTLTVGTPLTLVGWGLAWALVGVALILGSLLRRRWRQWAMGAMVFMLSATAAVYTYSWLLLFPPDNGEWSGGALYIGFTIALVALIRQDKGRPYRPLPPKRT